MSQAVQPIRVDVGRHLVRLRLARPDRYNVLDMATLASLAEALETNRRPLPLLLDGEGDVFSVGGDIAELAGFRSDEAKAYSRLGQRVVSALEDWPAVTVARISGYALGTGLELALGCDVLVGTSDVRLGLPGLAWALVPCLGGLRRLSCRLSSELCSELFLGGEVLEAPKALEVGLLDRVSDAPLERFAAGFGEFSSSAVAAIRGVRLERQGRIDADSEADLFAQPFASGECQKRLKKLLGGA
jgi:enoyl-CoA hydratase/carnithine racemase